MIYSFELQKKSILILVAALLISFSFASSPFSFFIYFAFIPFIRRIELSDNHREAFKVGYIIGLIVNIIVTYWIIYYQFSSYLLIIILNPLQFALFAYFYSHLKIFSVKAQIMIFPFLWTFFEYIREFGDFALNWLNIGYTQGNFIGLIQFADITGLNGVVFWICMINVVSYNIVYNIYKLKNKLINYFVIAVLFLLPFIYGYLQISKTQNRTGIMASYVQPNINSANKWNNLYLKDNINLLIEESENLEIEPNNLLIWPETALPKSIQEFEEQRGRIVQFLRDRRSYILAGIINVDSTGILTSKYNSAVLLSYDTTKKFMYNKIKLVPVAEYLPYSHFYDFLFSKFFLSNYYQKGSIKTVFSSNLQLYRTQFLNQKWKSIEKTDEINCVKFSTNICFESSFPSFVREFILNGAEFLIVQTNDEWFGYSSQPIQHLITSRFRSIENKTSVIHCSNAGISAFIDPYGRIYGTSKLLEKSSNTQIIPLRNELSFFSKQGDWTGKISTIFILIIFIVIFYRNQKNKIR